MKITQMKRAGLSSLRASLLLGFSLCFTSSVLSVILVIIFFVGWIRRLFLCLFGFFPRVDCSQQIVLGLAQLESNILAATFIRVIGKHGLFIRVLNFTLVV